MEKQQLTPEEKANIEKAKGILLDAGGKLLLVLLIPIIFIVSLFFGFIDLGNGKDFSKYAHGSSRRRRH